MNSASAKRIDIISDTHGYLSPALLDELEGADLIIHAGDLTSEMDYEHLCTIAPVRAVLGNNDYYRDYGPDVDRLALFTYEGLKFAVAHYREDLPVGSVDVAINGHTHVTKEAQVGRCLVLNPGSASYPRGTRGPTMARMLVKDGKIMVADPASYTRSEQLWDLSIILNEASRRAGAGGPFWIIG